MSSLIHAYPHSLPCSTSGWNPPHPGNGSDQGHQRPQWVDHAVTRWPDSPGPAALLLTHFWLLFGFHPGPTPFPCLGLASKAPVFLGSPRLPPEPQTEAPAGGSSYSLLAPPSSLAQFNPNPFIPQTLSSLTKTVAPAAPWSPASILCSLPQQLLSIPQQHQAFLNPRAFAHAILFAEKVFPTTLA